MTPYFEELCKAMKMLSEHPKTMFFGQSCREKGTSMFDTLRDVPMDRRIEMPVMENTQMGMCTGIAMAGGFPICLFPRINFFLEAIPQLVQHLDKIPLFSDYRPKVIIRTMVATDNPLNPGPQHLGDYADAIERMLSTVRLVRLLKKEWIIPAYTKALNTNHSTILVEYAQQMVR